MSYAEGSLQTLEGPKDVVDLVGLRFGHRMWRVSVGLSAERWRVRPATTDLDDRVLRRGAVPGHGCPHQSRATRTAISAITYVHAGFLRLSDLLLLRVSGEADDDRPARNLARGLHHAKTASGFNAVEDRHAAGKDMRIGRAN